MKKVINGMELKNKMKVAINLLCDTVKTTLGPIGNNVIINNSDFTPFITNDGVTIANSIESEDIAVNTILEIAKEATINTNDKVGDGTTTTLVLLQSIYEEGIKKIDSGIKELIVKNEIEKEAKEIIEKIKQESRKPTKEELLNIARISANDYEIGTIVYDVFSKIKDKKSITLLEGEETKINYLKGYTLDTILASPYFINNKILDYKNPYILLSDCIIYNVEDIVDILNYVYSTNSSLVIIANDYDDTFVNEILSLVINQNYKIVLLKIPDYGTRGIDILRDIESITLGKVSHDIYNIKSLGKANNIKIDKEKTTMYFSYNNAIKNRILELNKELKKEKNEYDIDFYKSRISMLKNKKAEIIVGANSKVERKEKLMRFEDALCSLSSAYNGVLVGSGLVLYKISEKLNDEIFSVALKKPLMQIIENAGLEKSIIEKIIDSDFNLVYNVSNLSFENIRTTSVLDSTDVVINSILNATSIAGMLLTTNSLVINEVINTNYDNL